MKKTIAPSIENPSAFKNMIHSGIVEAYARGIKSSSKKFDGDSFISISEELNQLELRDRVRRLAHGFQQCLPGDFPEKLNVLIQSIEKENLNGFQLWPVTEFIQIYGLQHSEKSLSALTHLTTLFTSEFAIRPFLIHDPKTTYAYLLKLTKSKNPLHRRWASEGTRPRLPWGERLFEAVKDPTPGLKILEHLKFDSEIYVRKSVANHLNDIAKDHPQLVVDTILRWNEQVPSSFKKEFDFIRKQALRSLVKQGHKEALKVFGVNSKNKNLIAGGLKIEKNKIKVGDKIKFHFALQNRAATSQAYIVDYIIQHRKANGELKPKVFKLKSGSLTPKENLNITKAHSFRKVTTRTYYKGEHRLEILLNGQVVLSKKFLLE